MLCRKDTDIIESLDLCDKVNGLDSLNRMKLPCREQYTAELLHGCSCHDILIVCLVNDAIMQELECSADIYVHRFVHDKVKKLREQSCPAKLPYH